MRSNSDTHPKVYSHALMYMEYAAASMMLTKLSVSPYLQAF